MGVDYYRCCECDEYRLSNHFDRCDSCKETLCDENCDPTCYKCDDDFYYEYNTDGKKYWLILCISCFENLGEQIDKEIIEEINYMIKENKIKDGIKYRPS